MNELSPIADFDDKSYDPFGVDLEAFGDINDIYAVLTKLRNKGPVLKGDLLTLLGQQGDSNYVHIPHYTVLGYDEIMAVDNDAETFSIDAYKENLGHTFGRTLSLMNPPEHTAVRKVFQKAFLPHTVAKWGDDIVSPVVNGLIDKFVDRSEADLVEEFAIQYPFQIIYKQLALPERDIATFHKLAVCMTQTFGDFIKYGKEANLKLGKYFTEMIAQRRKNPGDDLVSLLIQTEVDGMRIPDETIISFFRQLINAAGDTTYRGTASMLTGLLRHPDQLDQVRNDRKLVTVAIEEALRWEGPVTVHFRMCARDTELAGVKIEKGAVINVVLASANHDPKVFPEPEKFDIHRKRERHFAFGYGNHMCLGQHLARLEMTRAINAIFDRLPNLRLNPNKAQPEILGAYQRTPKNINVLFG